MSEPTPDLITRRSQINRQWAMLAAAIRSTQHPGTTDDEVIKLAKKFERYIEEGKT
jgi:hypothetical protein